MREPEAVRCASCGYDLTGLPEQSVCPECALRIEASLAQHRARTLSGAATRAVITHQACVGCGYDLFGLPVEGACPECSTPVRNSFGERLLRYGSRRYLRGLSTASAVLVAGTWVLTLGVCLAPVAPIGLMLICLGWWGVSAPPPDLAVGRVGRTARELTRLFALLTVLAMIVAVLGWQFGARFGLQWHDAVMIPAYATGATTLGMTLAGTCVVRALANRVPDRELGVSASTAFALGWVVPAFAATAWVVSLGLAGGMAGLFVVLAFFGCIVWVLIVFNVIHRLHASASDEARYATRVDLGRAARHTPAPARSAAHDPAPSPSPAPPAQPRIHRKPDR